MEQQGRPNKPETKSAEFTLAIRAGGQEYRFNAAKGRSVREILDETDIRVCAGCGATGSCGICIVRVLEGETNPPTAAELRKLPSDALAAGSRLACQLRLGSDAIVEFEQLAPASWWRSIPDADLQPIDLHVPALEKNVFGIAVDLGTTDIRVALWNRRRGKRVATRIGCNPQKIFGTDTLSRLKAAHSSPEQAHVMSCQARAAIFQAVYDMLERDIGEPAAMLARIGLVVITGNSAMLALLCEANVAPLLAAESWQTSIDCTPLDSASWQAGWLMPNAKFFIAPPITGTVGSDLIADLVATELCHSPEAAMLIDIGSQSEIALWDGKRLRVASVPGGQVFEGVGIRNGMPAKTGAIYRLHAGTTDGFDCATIGGDEALGLCGSGLVDALALLRSTGIIQASGNFMEPADESGFRLVAEYPRSVLTSDDIEALQHAKAAIAAAMEAVLAEAGINWKALRRLCVCGAFGHHLDLAHARMIGLLPPLAPHLIELHANATLAGCEHALLSSNPAEVLQSAHHISPVNVAQQANFEHLRLLPISDGNIG